MLLSYGVLLKRIWKSVRKRALEVPRFARTKEGCIRVTACPMCDEAVKWFGTSDPFDEDDIPDCEVARVILPGGSRVAHFRGANRCPVTVDTYAITAMKIAQLSLFQDKGILVSTSKKRRGLTPENGFGNWCGAICCEVLFSDGSPFCYIYVSVSGADEMEDLACAAAAIGTIGRFFSRDKRLTVFAPVIRKRKAEIVIVLTKCAFGSFDKAIASARKKVSCGT